MRVTFPAGTGYLLRHESCSLFYLEGAALTLKLFASGCSGPPAAAPLYSHGIDKSIPLFSMIVACIPYVHGPSFKFIRQWFKSSYNTSLSEKEYQFVIDFIVKDLR